MSKKILTLLVSVAAVLGLSGYLLLPAQAATQALGTARGLCVKSGTGEIRSLRLTTDGKCQTGWWGPTAFGSSTAGKPGPAGPKGEQGPKGEPGQAASCPDGYSVKDITVANAAKTKADAEALKKAQADLTDAKAVLVAKEKAVADADAAIVKAQAGVDAATTVEAKEKAAKVLADAVVAKAAAVNAVAVAEKAVAAAQAVVDKLVAEIAAPALYVIKACVKG